MFSWVVQICTISSLSCNFHNFQCPAGLELKDEKVKVIHILTSIYWMKGLFLRRMIYVKNVLFKGFLAAKGFNLAVVVVLGLAEIWRD